MKHALPVLALLCACGITSSVFEGVWTGSVNRAFQCEPLGNGSSSDFPVTMTVALRLDKKLDVELGDAYGCSPLVAELDPKDQNRAALGDAGCPATDGGGILNIRTLTGGELRKVDAGVVLTLFEDDRGEDPMTPYICHGTSFGVLTQQGDGG